LGLESSLDDKSIPNELRSEAVKVQRKQQLTNEKELNQLNDGAVIRLHPKIAAPMFLVSVLDNGGIMRLLINLENGTLLHMSNHTIAFPAKVTLVEENE
jgi:hypothetical protein